MSKRESTKTISQEDWKWAAAQVAALKDGFRDTALSTLLFKKVEFSVRSASHGMKASGAWLFGESGAGKSTMLLECKRRIERLGDIDSDLPVLYQPLLPSPTMHTIARALLQQVQYPFARSRTFGERAEILFDALRKRRVRSIMFDEGQHIVEGNRTGNQRDIRDFLKRMYDETNVCLVIAGLPKLSSLRDNDDQLASRIPAVIDLEPLSGGALALGVLNDILKVSPLPFQATAASRLVTEVDKRRHTNQRQLGDLVEESVKIAALGRNAEVTTKHVEHAISFVFLGKE